MPGLLRSTPPFRKQAALDGIFVVIIVFQFEHTDGIWVTVQVSIFLVLLYRSEMTGGLYTPGSTGTFDELTSQPY